MTEGDGQQPVALVTGANRGIGLEVVRQLAEQGWKVHLGSRDLGRGTAAVAKLGPTCDGEVVAAALDVADVDSIRSALADIARRSGRLHILVNNAAIHYDSHQSVSGPDFGVVDEALTGIGRP